MRGNPHPAIVTEKSHGSIPASAGEPLNTCFRSWPPGVYPRECGGTFSTFPRRPQFRGLSPRVRGNPWRRELLAVSEGSIPASAGEPSRRVRVTGSVVVYPRECGGTARSEEASNSSSGLSPRVRGNLGANDSLPEGGGSIPASAGEPHRSPPISERPTVYPRECGGTEVALTAISLVSGLSPRVRGNPAHVPVPDADVGSIPASAGEPRARRGPSSLRGVYPRECGGTHGQGRTVAPRKGLSPRVRGNQCPSYDTTARVGSIPASAGEPRSARRSSGRKEVYPRECGGTLATDASACTMRGLSPRVRGNRRWYPRPEVILGSIPASAGEPKGVFPVIGPAEVYPRECGGTERRTALMAARGGLSPRVRGNRRGGSSPAPRRRSIPASAGEPRPAAP